MVKLGRENGESKKEEGTVAEIYLRKNIIGVILKNYFITDWFGIFIFIYFCSSIYKLSNDQ